MYSTMEAHSDFLARSISGRHVARYGGLLRDMDTCVDAAYRSEFRSYWAMNVARLGDQFYQCYFDTLAEGCTPEELPELLNALYRATERDTGRPSLQFSFATKLVHMHNPHSPIYDRQVASFYGLFMPSTRLPLESRIEVAVTHYWFLRAEYARVLKLGLLDNCIEAFRACFPDGPDTDERVIDSLIWAFTSKVWSGAVGNGDIRYI